MAKWRQLLQPPAGALPGGLVTKAGVGVIAVLLAGLVLSQAGGDTEAPGSPAGDPEAAGQGVVGQIRSRLSRLAEQRQIEEQSRAGRAAAAAAELAAGRPPTLPGAAPVGRRRSNTVKYCLECATNDARFPFEATENAPVPRRGCRMPRDCGGRSLRLPGTMHAVGRHTNTMAGSAFRRTRILTNYPRAKTP